MWKIGITVQTEPLSVSELVRTKKGRDRRATVALEMETFLIAGGITQPRPVACQGDLRLTQAGLILLQPRELRCRELIGSSKDAPVRQRKGCAAHTACSTRAQGRHGKVRFAK